MIDEYHTLNRNDGSDDDSVNSDALSSAHLQSGARRVFCTHKLRPKQLVAIKRIVKDEATDTKLLVVDKTGGGRALYCT